MDKLKKIDADEELSDSVKLSDDGSINSVSDSSSKSPKRKEPE